MRDCARGKEYAAVVLPISVGNGYSFGSYRGGGDTVSSCRSRCEWKPTLLNSCQKSHIFRSNVIHLLGNKVTFLPKPVRLLPNASRCATQSVSRLLLDRRYLLVFNECERLPKVACHGTEVKLMTEESRGKHKWIDEEKAEKRGLLCSWPLRFAVVSSVKM